MTAVIIFLGIVFLPEVTLAFCLFSLDHAFLGIICFLAIAVKSSNTKIAQRVTEKVKIVERVVYREGNRMTREDAYAALGLTPGVGDDAVRRAWRTMMQRVHPDAGGSTWLAARVNEAKQMLVK